MTDKNLTASFPKVQDVKADFVTKLVNEIRANQWKSIHTDQLVDAVTKIQEDAGKLPATPSDVLDKLTLPFSQGDREQYQSVHSVSWASLGENADVLNREVARQSGMDHVVYSAPVIDLS